MASRSHLRKPDAVHVRREWGTVVENDLRLPREAAAMLVDALNAELSGLYILFNQVRKHYWTVEGAESTEVADFLASAADRLAETTDDVALRVHALGGVPVCGPMGIREHAPMYIEAANRYDLRSSLARDLDGYATLAVRMREHVELAAELGDAATGELLRGRLRVLEADAQTLDRYLADDTLVRNDATR
ncbi:DNA starvation/stationary phase protection protein DpsA [Halegenticoccus tardaugens]|uniref:DNA starvation/stationary phase protection protein DpsA n=1 Tax=Halegenticoccus tardaugens TaxID=2071624 RepID=UPI00100A69F1|nr:DNA starvation/stationary phase protection protein DpsA [Halegenticoccus tardaugens]